MLPNIESFEIGAILAYDHHEYIVVCRNGVKCVERIGDDGWHGDTHVFLMGGDEITDFIKETLEAIEESFPHLGLSAADKVELALTLWRQYKKEKISW